MTARTGGITWLDVPDPSVRSRKARWLCLREVLEDAAAAALVDASPLPQPVAALSGGDDVLRRGLARALQHPVILLDDPSWSGRTSLTAGRFSLSVLVLPEDLSRADRRALLRGAVRQLRPTGLLVLVATVVADPLLSPEHPPPSIGQLLEEVAVAGGGTLMEERVESFRWPSEDYVRGVVLTLRLLHSEAVDDAP